MNLKGHGMSPHRLEIIVCIYAVCALLLTLITVCVFIKKRHISTGTGKREFAKLWSIAFLLICAGFLCLVLKKHYGVDSFIIYWYPAPFHPISEGRYLKAALSIFYDRTGINQIVYQQVFFAIYLPMTALAVVMIASSMIRVMKVSDFSKKLMILAASALVFVNTFTMELLMFPEVALESAVGNIVFASGIYIFLSDMKRYLRWPLTFVFLFIMTTGYQLYMPMFIPLVLVASGIKNSGETKRKYAEAFFALISGVLAWGLDYTLIILSERSGAVDPTDSAMDLSLQAIKDNAVGVIKMQLSLWNNCFETYRIHYLMTAVGAGLAIIFIISLIKTKGTEGRLYYLLVIGGSYLLAFALHFAEQPQEITPRSILPVWSVLSAMILLGLYKEARPVYLVLIATLMINIYHMNDMSLNLLETNKQDLYEASVIADRIKEYEDATGIEVTETSFRSDGNMTYHHTASRYKNYQLGARIMATYFSRHHCVGYFLGRDLTDEFMSDEDLQRLGKGKDWDEFVPDEQIFIEDGKAYVITY